MSEQKPALEAFSLTKSRRRTSGEPYVWRCPDLVVEPGQFVTVFGDQPNDVQLMLALLSGLVEPTGGVLRIDGQDAGDTRRKERARLRAAKVGLLFGEPRLLPGLTVLDNVVLPSPYAGVARSKAKARAEMLLQRLGLGDALAKLPAHLTPLQGQLVSLARALVNHPVVILADDPAAGLPELERDRYARILRQACEQDQVALVYGTSRPQLFETNATTIHMPPSPSESIPVTQEGIASGELFDELYQAEISPLLRPVAPLLDYVLKPLLYVGVVALVIVFLTFFGLRMARAGRASLVVDVGEQVSESVTDSMVFLSGMLRGDLGTYDNQVRFHYWSGSERQIGEALERTMDKSLGLLLLSMVLGGAIGLVLGLLGAVLRHRKFSLVFVVAAIVGVSTPSFFLALVLQMLEVALYRRTGVSLLPVGGFGWDDHIVLPALVLAARPIAQVARVSFVALSEVLDADYIRTARAKGLVTRAILAKHALRNAGVPVLAAMGTSLGFSLSSLPIVETIFQWPGMGLMLLDAVRTQQAPLAAALAMMLGIFFVIVHVALNFLYRWIDPRMRDDNAGLGVQRSWLDMVSMGWSGFRALPDKLDTFIPWLRRQAPAILPPLPVIESSPDSSNEQRRRDAKIKIERRRAWIQSTAGSLPFVLGAAIVLVLLGAVVVGQQIAPHSAYSAYPSLEVDGELRYAPFPPSDTFPLGTDPQGRDILSLLLYGARRTMSLAFFAVLARILLGTVLGALSGWFSDSLLDRVVMGLTQVIAAFPALLLGMVLIYAFGIRQGLWVFALALSVIGWGESAQFVRSQVMHIREQDYVEGALATGLGDLQLLSRHVLPNLVPSLVVLAFLEMGGVLMLLGELGFIGVFIGGGTRTISAQDTLVVYFDVPEWGVMLSNTWRSFRSYPWMTFYPALAFTLSIIGFNLLGEGLRRLTERLTLSMHRIINRYTVGAAFGVGLLLMVAAEGTGSWAQFAPTARGFDEGRAMEDIEYLAAPAMDGRHIENPELGLAAEYIAGQFEALGLQPGGPVLDSGLSYFVPVPYEYHQLSSVPSLELFDSTGETLGPLVYRTDFAEVPDAVERIKDLEGEVVCVGMSTNVASYPAGWPTNLDYDAPDLLDKVILLPTGQMPPQLGAMDLRAVLLVADDEDLLTHRELATGSIFDWLGRGDATVFMFITPGVAEAILRHGGYELSNIRQRQSQLSKSDGFVLPTGVDATIQMDVSDTKRGLVQYVQAIVPGHDVGSQALDTGMDRDMVILLANYEGIGRDMDGTVYPGANKNASGVAVMLETARLLKEANYQPYRTLLFVAWAGEEIREPPSYWNMLRARPGWLERYRISAVIDLTGLGAGTSNTLLVHRSTSNRLTEVLQQATARLGVESTTRGTSIYGVYSSLYPAADIQVPQITITWEGSYVSAHTPQDTIENIDPLKLRDAGRVAALAVMFLGHEKEY